MKHNIIGYLIGEGFRNVFKNKKSSGASLAIICATMLIFGLFFVILENINNMVRELEEKQGIQVFIKGDASEEQIQDLENQIKILNGVNTITFVSKEDALNSMREKLGNKQNLLAGWDEDNPFRASYVITLTDLNLSSEIQDSVAKIDSVYSVESKDEVIEALVFIANIIRIISFSILGLLIIISMFIISNTIKLTVHARRKEISIMKYVGATDNFIRWPFIIEGILIGILAAIISIALIAAIYLFASGLVMKSSQLVINGLSLLSFDTMINLLILVYMVLGIGIGVLGSSFSIRKYLKV